MASKTLRADIIVGGRADSSFTALGQQIASLGNLLNPISSKLIEFGKESVKAYASYEDAMLDAQAALRTQYRSTTELNHVIGELDKAALQWANDSRFTTEDVAGAISNAAHAGWDLEKMLNGIPAAMKLSLAGGMDLSQGLEYMVDISNAAGISFGELKDLTDYWAYAANKSSTTIPEMGEAMQKMGATLQFVKGDMAELTTMLAVLANNGQKGTEAGTLLRNTMLRLIAPTKTAAQAMGDLNLTAEELDEIYQDDSGLENAVKFLEETGFSAYDAQGNLKSFLDIFAELDKATKGMTEEERNDILSSIFPTRTITGALALLEAADNAWNGLYDDIQTTGRGYADYAAETMESGIGGTLRHLESVYNTLQTKVGENLSGEVGKGAEAITGMLDAVNGMDNRAFTAMVDGLGALALAGPAMTAVGGAMKFLPMLGAILASPGAIGAGALVAAAGLGKIIYDMNELNALEQWGGLGLDEDNIRGWLNGIQDEFATATKEITDYTDKAKNAADVYKQTSTSLKESLLTFSATGKTLTDADRAGLSSFANQITDNVISTIQNSNAAAQMAAAMFGHGEIADGIIQSLNEGLSLSVGKAEELGRNLSEVIRNAISDGSIDTNDILDIQGILDQLNELEAAQLEGKNEAVFARAMREAQTMGLDNMQGALGIIQGAEDTAIGLLGDSFETLYAQTAASNKMQLENGSITQEQADSNIEAVNAWYAEQANAIKARTKNAEAATLLNGITGTQFGQLLLQMAAQARNGNVDADLIRQYVKTENSERWGLNKQIENAIDSIGGTDALIQALNYAEETGDASSAQIYQQLLDIQKLSAGGMGGLSESLMSISNGGEYLMSGVTVPVDAEADFSNVEAEKENLATPVTFSVSGIFTGVSGRAGKFGNKVSGGIGGAYAEGGRAEEASIFGEAGPEWAIPEAHTTRTAELLRQAAQASGFSWPELAAGRTSGGNTLVYSPTIIAQNADGVAAKLQDDKSRLEKYLKEKKWIDSVEVYQ